MLTKLMRLGRDAELRYLADGSAVANLALAYNYGKKADKLVQWVDAGLFGKRAEALASYLTKGTAIVVSMEDVHVKTFAKKDGTQGSTLAGRVASLEFAGGQKQENGAAAAAKPAPAKPAAPVKADEPFADDDIPF